VREPPARRSNRPCGRSCNRWRHDPRFPQATQRPASRLQCAGNNPRRLCCRTRARRQSHTASPRSCSGREPRFRVCRLLLPAGNARDAKLQLWKALRDVKGGRTRRWGNLDRGRLGRSVPMQSYTLPANASTLVRVGTREPRAQATVASGTVARGSSAARRDQATMHSEASPDAPAFPIPPATLRSNRSFIVSLRYEKTRRSTCRRVQGVARNARK
jgi:hypothetical protein